MGLEVQGMRKRGRLHRKDGDGIGSTRDEEERSNAQEGG